MLSAQNQPLFFSPQCAMSGSKSCYFTAKSNKTSIWRPAVHFLYHSYKVYDQFLWNTSSPCTFKRTIWVSNLPNPYPSMLSDLKFIYTWYILIGFKISNWMHLSVRQVDCKNHLPECTIHLSEIYKANATYVKIRNTQSSVGQVLQVFHLSDCHFYYDRTSEISNPIIYTSYILNTGDEVWI